MSDSWTKLFGSILDSSVWMESKETRLVWITMLAMKDKDGFVSAAVPGLARRAGVNLEECEAALSRLTSPDAHSRSREYEGRRVEQVDGGWMVLNHFKYRDEIGDRKRERWKRQKARQRARKNGRSDFGVDRREDPEGHVMGKKRGKV